MVVNNWYTRGGISSTSAVSHNVFDSFEQPVWRQRGWLGERQRERIQVDRQTGMVARSLASIKWWERKERAAKSESLAVLWLHSLVAPLCRCCLASPRRAEPCRPKPARRPARLGSFGPAQLTKPVTSAEGLGQDAHKARFASTGAHPLPSRALPPPCHHSPGLSRRSSLAPPAWLTVSRQLPCAQGLVVVVSPTPAVGLAGAIADDPGQIPLPPTPRAAAPGVGDSVSCRAPVDCTRIYFRNHRQTPGCLSPIEWLSLIAGIFLTTVSCDVQWCLFFLLPWSHKEILLVRVKCCEVIYKIDFIECLQRTDRPKVQ